VKRLLNTLLIIFLLLTFIGCKPEYVTASSIEVVYRRAINEVENAKTPQSKLNAWQNVQIKILKAQNWYLENDHTNPRLKELQEMHSLFKL